MLFPEKHKFKVWRGATFRHIIDLYSDEEGTIPRDLTGYSALLEIRKDANTGEPLFTLSTENGGIEIDGPQGVITLFIDAADTQAFTWNTGVYDLTITGPLNGDTDALLYGSFTVSGV